MLRGEADGHTYISLSLSISMALAQVCASLSLSVRDVPSPSTQRIAGLPTPNIARIRSVFTTGSPLLIHKSSSPRRSAYRATPISIRCEQSTQESSSVDVWLGRFAMVGFAVAISIEIATGKGLLENFGLTTPLPTVALAVTALVGVLTAVFIFQSASKK